MFTVGWCRSNPMYSKVVLVAVFFVLVVPVMALAQNNPPVADAGEDQTIFVNDSVTLQGSATDPDGHPIVGWEWEVVSAPPGSSSNLSAATTPNAVFTANTAGGYGITLRAWDGLEWSEPDALVAWLIENQPPDAVASGSPLSGPAPLTVDFDGNGSFDPEGGALWYDWDFGDFTSGTGVTPGHEYLSPGIYVARLMVTDDRGNIDFDTVEITVTAPAVPSIHPIALYTLLPSLLVGAGLVAMRRSGGRR
jgi:PKD repeat protein